MNIVLDVGSNLNTNNILGGTDGWVLTRGTFIEENLSSAIIATGERKLPLNTSSLLRYPSFQLLFASDDYIIGYDKADETYKYLLQTAQVPNYLISPSTGILHLGLNKKNIHLFSINFESFTTE